MAMKKELFTLIAFLSFFACNSQPTEVKSQHFSIGVGLGYGLLQDRYDDGTYAYQYSDNLLRPFIFNLRYTWNNNKTRSTLLNAQYTFYIRTSGDIIEFFPMVFLTGGMTFKVSNLSDCPRGWIPYRKINRVCAGVRFRIPIVSSPRPGNACNVFPNLCAGVQGLPDGGCQIIIELSFLT